MSKTQTMHEFTLHILVVPWQDLNWFVNTLEKGIVHFEGRKTISMPFYPPSGKV